VAASDGEHRRIFTSGDRRNPSARQRSSHAKLIRDFSARLPRSGTFKPLDALIVPVGRKAEKLQTVAELAASLTSCGVPEVDLARELRRCARASGST
jgi:hypothetical protein